MGDVGGLGGSECISGLNRKSDEISELKWKRDVAYFLLFCEGGDALAE